MFVPKGKAMAECHKKIRAFMKTVPHHMAVYKKSSAAELKAGLKKCGDSLKCRSKAYTKYNMGTLMMKSGACRYSPKCSWKR